MHPLRGQERSRAKRSGLLNMTRESELAPGPPNWVGRFSIALPFFVWSALSKVARMNRKLLSVLAAGLLIMGVSTYLAYPSHPKSLVDTSKAKYMHCPKCMKEKGY